MKHVEFSINVHSTNIYGQYFQPETVKAVVVLVHGMGEHSSRYVNYVIPYYNKNNIAVLTYDQFGHGKTEGKKGYNPGFESVLDCVTEMLKKAKDLFGDKPTFLYGHSMGGNVVINYVLRRPNTLKGIVVTSPFLKLAFTPPKWKLSVGKMLLKIAPSLTMGNELDATFISRDKNAVEAYKNDPLVHDKISPNYSVVFIETGKWAMQNANKLKIPMLLMHGTGDKITSHKASVAFAKSNPKNVTLQLFENAYHELHNEINKDEVLESMLAWVNKQLIKSE